LKGEILLNNGSFSNNGSSPLQRAGLDNSYYDNASPGLALIMGRVKAKRDYKILAQIYLYS
jgi:hypothetical protein